MSCHHPSGGAQDADTQSTKYFGDFCRLDVCTSSRSADSAQSSDDGYLVLPILQLDVNLALMADFVATDLVDIPFALQEFGNGELEV